MALQQAQRGKEDEHQKGTLVFSQIERALQGPVGGGLVAGRVPGHGLQHESVH
jgi:hypothetical protein